jgi:hypothetical protein
MDHEVAVAETKAARATIKNLVDTLNASPRQSRSRKLTITKLEEASMWLGKDLQELNEPNPYPTSHDPSVKEIDPTAPEACNLPPFHSREFFEGAQSALEEVAKAQQNEIAKQAPEEDILPQV